MVHNALTMISDVYRVVYMLHRCACLHTFLLVFTSCEYFLKQLKKWKLHKPDHVCLLMEMEDSFYFGYSRIRLEFDIKWIYKSNVLVSPKCF